MSQANLPFDTVVDFAAYRARRAEHEREPTEREPTSELDVRRRPRELSSRTIHHRARMLAHLTGTRD